MRICAWCWVRKTEQEFSWCTVHPTGVGVVLKIVLEDFTIYVGRAQNFMATKTTMRLSQGIVNPKYVADHLLNLVLLQSGLGKIQQ